MSSYTITVVPNDDSGAQTTLVVDTAGGQARVTDVHLRAPSGLTEGRMPAIDVGLLLRAVSPSPITASQSPVAIDPPPADVAPAAGTDDTGDAVSTADIQSPAAPAAPDSDDEPVAVLDDAEATAPSQPRSGGAPRRRTAATAEPAKKVAAVKKVASVRKTASRRSAVQEPGGQAVTAAGRRKRATAAPQQEAPAGRVYRRMPDDLSSVYQQTSSPSAIAAHYDVPRHTAQGWVRRLVKVDPQLATSSPSRGSRRRRS